MVAKKPKGEVTRLAILEQARTIFNRQGILITLDHLASEMGIPKGRITNHFSTKDKLFLAILAEYEQVRSDMLQKNSRLYASAELTDYVCILEKIMDIQYEYRSAMLYLMVIAQGQEELRDHVMNNLKRNQTLIKSRLVRLVKEKVLAPSILEGRSLNSFMFIYINTLTQWIIYYDLYDGSENFQKAKALYLHSIMHHVYGPHLASKGKRQLKEIFSKMDGQAGNSRQSSAR